jgi:hypothetical protein
MIYITERSGYIDGVFSGIQEAFDYLRIMKKDQRAGHTMRCLNFKFPFFIVENQDRALRFLYMQDIRPKDIEILNPHIIYRIERSWLPSKPGIDEMGRLDHEHYR